MSKQVEFWFDFGSPTAYLAWTQLPKIAERTGAEIIWRPMLLGGVFKATGNASPAMVPAKGLYMNRDLARFAARYGVTLNFNPDFPINTLPLMRGAVAAQAEGDDFFQRYVTAVYEAMWLKPCNMGDPAVVAGVLKEAGIDPDWFAAAIADPDVKAKLVAATDEAIAKGAFGAPTFFVGGEMYFGQDRLDFIEEQLAA